MYTGINGRSIASTNCAQVKKEHLELKWILEQYLSHNRLERMTSWKVRLRTPVEDVLDTD